MGFDGQTHQQIKMSLVYHQNLHIRHIYMYILFKEGHVGKRQTGLGQVHRLSTWVQLQVH